MTPRLTNLTVEEADDCSPLAQFLRSKLQKSGKEVKQLLDQRSVLVNGRRIWIAKHQLQVGDLVQVAVARLSPPLTMLKQGAQWLVIDKPCGLVATGPGESSERRLRIELKDSQLFAVHRLDRDTSGCLLFARGQDARAPLEALFRRHQVDKEYLVLVAGRMPQQILHCSEPIADQRAVSTFRCLAQGKQIALLSARIETGRMHQIRIHLAQLGHPVVGEREYASGKLSSQILRAAPRQMLHAYRLAFNSPWGEGIISCQSEPPQDFVDLAQAAGIPLAESILDERR